MDINQLKCFVSVARTLNFSEAARRNYVSQSTVSRYIIELEKEFGVQLFVRSHRDVVLTNEGKTLLPYAIEIIETLSKATSVIRQMHDGGKGRITIACDATSFSFPSVCIEAFAEKYPEINIEVKELDTSENGTVFNGEYDFCFMPRDMLPESASIESIVTHSEQLSVITSKKGKLSSKKNISLSEIADCNMVLLSEKLSPILYMEIMDLFRTFHISPNVVNTYDDVKSMLLAVSSGLGVSIVPESLLSFVNNSTSVSIPVSETDTGISYVMAWSRGTANPAAKLFIDMVNKFAHDDEGLYDI